jgi:hypothetical protein
MLLQCDISQASVHSWYAGRILTKLFSIKWNSLP